MPAKQKASKSTNNKYAPTKWGQEYTCDLTVPSGQLCLVRRPGPAGLIKAGLFDSLDALTGLVQAEHIDRSEPSAEGEKRREALREMSTQDMMELAGDPKKLKSLMELMERVVCHVVLQPALLPVPEEGEDRVPGGVYVDSVDLMDQFFIFNFVLGGTEDLVEFREKFGSSVGSLEALSGVSNDPS